MVIKVEQERVKTLIIDTVSLLCKNGLNYTKEFSIEGLLGITLDRDDVFLVSIKEFVKTDSCKDDSDSDNSEASSGDESLSKSAHKRRKRRKSKSKQGEGDETSNDTNTSFAQPSSLEEPPVKKINIKEEREEDDSDEDLVFVKDEPGDSGSHSFNQGQYGAQSNNVLGDMAQQGQLYATPTSDPLPSSSGWDPSQAAFSQQQPLTSPSNPAQAGQQNDDFHLAYNLLHSGRKDDNGVKYVCLECGKTLASAVSLKRHMNEVHYKNYRLQCEFCKKGYASIKDLKEHRTSHTNINYFNCSDCGESFRYYWKLKHHKMLNH